MEKKKNIKNISEKIYIRVKPEYYRSKFRDYIILIYNKIACLILIYKVKIRKIQELIERYRN